MTEAKKLQAKNVVETQHGKNGPTKVRFDQWWECKGCSGHAKAPHANPAAPTREW